MRVVVCVCVCVCLFADFAEGISCRAGNVGRGIRKTVYFCVFSGRGIHARAGNKRRGM